MVSYLKISFAERVVLEEFPGAAKRPQATDNIYHPFGTPGGGNPNFDKSGNRIAIIPGPSTVNVSDAHRVLELDTRMLIP